MIHILILNLLNIPLSMKRTKNTTNEIYSLSNPMLLKIYFYIDFIALVFVSILSHRKKLKEILQHWTSSSFLFALWHAVRDVGLDNFHVTKFRLLWPHRTIYPIGVVLTNWPTYYWFRSPSDKCGLLSGTSFNALFNIFSW